MSIHATRINLCGGLAVVWEGQPLDPPGRQGRLLFAYLVLNRRRFVRRGELVDALWPNEDVADRAEALLSPPLSRLRKVLPPGALGGRGDLTLHLPDAAWVDWEAALGGLDHTREALRTGDFSQALESARDALAIAGRELLPEFDAPWIDERQRELADVRLGLLEATAMAGARLGGAALPPAERAARDAVDAAPFRESARAALMEVLHASGNTAEALRAYDDARQLFLDELGTPPGPALVALHKRLLHADGDVGKVEPPPSAPPRLLATTPVPLPRPSLVERERERGDLQSLIEATAAGGGRMVVVEGPAGIGKSQLLLDARARAGDHGVVAPLARASELERDFPFGIVRQLFEPFLADPAQREQLLAGAAAPAQSVFGELEAADDGGDVSYAVLHGLYWMALNLVARAPVMLAIDDLQWADRASLRFLAYLGRRLEGVPVLIAATVRTGEPPTDPALHADLLADPATVTVRPSPLTQAAVAELVRARLGDDADDPFCTACHRATGGNPLLVQQLIAALAADNVKPDAEHADVVRDVGPRAVSRSVLMRLARLRGDAVPVARAVAVLGESADLPAVAALAEISEQDVAVATGLLARAELLRPESPLGFVHPLIRDAVYHELPPGERELQHLGAARVLERLGASEEQVSSHLLAVPRRGDAWVARTLTAAGNLALRRGAAESSVTYLTRALEEPPPEDEVGAVLSRLGHAEERSMTGNAAEHLAAAQARLTDPVERAVAAWELGRVMLFTRPPGEAARVARDAMAELEAAEAPELVELHERHEALEIAAWLFGAAVDVPAERLERIRSTPVGAGAGSRMQAAMASYVIAMSGGSADVCGDLAFAALEDDVLLEAENGLTTIFALMVMAMADRRETVPLWDHALADAYRRGAVSGITGNRFWRGWALARHGELDEAERALRTAIDDFEVWGFRPLLVWPTAFLGGLLVERGDLDGARTALTRGGPLTPTHGSMFWLLADAELQLAADDPDAALADAEAVAARVGPANNPAFFPWRALKARALDRLGRTDEALVFAREELELARIWGAASTVGRSLRVLGTLEREAGIERLEEACELLADSPARIEHAKALAALGSALRRARRPAESRAPLGEALEIATRCGATALVDHVRAELLASGARPRTGTLSGLGSLTPSERRVADLASGGLTNRDIAQKLFVTPKTVEVHLSNTYRKLGIRSRRELAAALEAGE